jgi:hypothetical protein
MTTPNPLERLAVAGREAARLAEKTTAEVVAAFSGTGANNAIERAARAHEESQKPPKPAIELQPKGIKREASKTDRENAVEAAIQDVTNHRAYSAAAKTNPFLAASIRARVGNASLSRGEALDRDDEPPSAA